MASCGLTCWSRSLTLEHAADGIVVTPNSTNTKSRLSPSCGAPRYPSPRMCRRRKGVSRPANKAHQDTGGTIKWRGNLKRNESSNANTRIEQCARAGTASFSAPVQTSANITFVCPVSLDVILDPVCKVDGQTYERRYIERWMKNNDTSPLTNLKLSPRNWFRTMPSRPIYNITITSLSQQRRTQKTHSSASCSVGS